MLLAALIITALQNGGAPAGTVVQARGAGALTCATAFLPQNRIATENWIAGYWAAWDMARIASEKPLAANADLAGIVGEVEKVCRDEPSSTLLIATLTARKAVKARWSKIR